MAAALRSGVDELPEAGGRTGGETHLAIDDPDLLSGEQDAHAGALTRPGDRNRVLDAVLSGLGLLGLGRDPLDLDGVQEIGIQVKRHRGAGRGLRGEVDGELTRCRVTLKAFVLNLEQALGILSLAPAQRTIGEETGQGAQEQQAHGGPAHPLEALRALLERHVLLDLERGGLIRWRLPVRHSCAVAICAYPFP